MQERLTRAGEGQRLGTYQAEDYGCDLHLEPMRIATTDIRGLYSSESSGRHRVGTARRQQQLHRPTDDVIRSFENRLPIRRAFEPTPGQSNARNRIVAEATGDYILWTDDDVTVSPDWLVVYAEAFRARPGAGCSAARSSPRSTELRRPG